MRYVFLVIALGAMPAWAQTSDDFFNPGVLHEIRFDIHPTDWRKLRDDFQSNTFYPCDLRWNGMFVEQVHIRSRGRGTRSGEKPGLRVDIDREDTKRTFLGLTSFILDNNAQDASMLKERVTMRLFARLGLPAPRQAHARVYVNDQYVGLYGLSESIDKRFLTRVFGENDGYLYEYDWQRPYYFEYLGADSALYSPTPFKPQTHEKDPKPAHLEAFIRAIDPAQTPDPVFLSAIEPFLDLNRFLQHVAIENFIAEWDGVLGNFGLNNFYFYRFEKKNLSQFIVWDKDTAFGGFLTDAESRIQYPVFQGADENILMRRAMTFPSLLERYLQHLGSTADSAGGRGGWLEQEIQRQYQLVRSAAREDVFKQCSSDGQTVRACTNEEFEAEVAFLLEFARQRGNFVLIELVSRGLAVPVTERPFAMEDRGGISTITAGGAETAVVGYAKIQPDAGSLSPSGVAIFGSRRNNLLVTEASVPATAPLRSGRIYAEIRGAVGTGVAIANPNTKPAEVSFYFTDSAGANFGQGTVTIPAGGQVARFLHEAPFNGGSALSGAFTFSASVPVGVVALRGFTNERSEFLITTLPVVDLSIAARDSFVLPHFADGGGWTSQLVLINPSDQAVAGNVQFYDTGSASAPGAPLTLTIDGQTGTTFAFSISPRSSRVLRTSGSSGAVRTGSVRVSATGGRPVAGLAIFSFRSGGVTVTETGIPVLAAGSAFRLYAEYSGGFGNQEPGSIQTGVAIANASTSPVVIRFELTDLAGNSAGEPGAVTVPANGQVVRFLNQLPGFESLAEPFQGILRIATNAAAGITLTGLRGRYNENRDFLIASTPPIPEGSGPTGELVFPHLVEGGGYTTQLILFSAGGPASGRIRFFSQNGQELKLTFR